MQRRDVERLEAELELLRGEQRGVLGEAQVREVVRGFVLDNLPAGTALSAADCAEQTLMQLGASSMSIMQALALVNARFSTEITMRMVLVEDSRGG